MNDLTSKLRTLGKSYYSISDLSKIAGMSRNSMYVTLSRLVQRKTLVRLTSGIYILPEQYNQIDVIANALRQPSYLSFESALSRYGILSQVPYTLTFATTQRSLRRRLGETEVEYRQLKSSLFFGYDKIGSLFIASPEKSLLDTVYFISYGKRLLKLENLDIREVNFARVEKLARKFPERTRQLIRKILKAQP